MPPKDHTPGSPADWLRYAYSDLKLAQMPAPAGVLLENLCFHAQQAAEKAIKAVLVAYGISIPKTHNLRTLVDFLSETLAVPLEVQMAVGLTDYAVSARYPGVIEPVDERDHQEAISFAEAVVYWAEEIIEAKQEIDNMERQC
ncbi:MAG TPA: HEPN domain-containing protein [Anaerolineae bacterium]|nr:HEPN domain-containing protein [Anaerolineae bacterium]